MNLHLFPPKELDYQARMVFIDSTIAGHFKPSNEGAKLQISSGNLMLKTFLEPCFNAASITLKLLEFNLYELFKNDLTVVSIRVDYISNDQ